ncbi:MAG: saccharopine dehydrogenase NADP-binding domain-containing protein [Planctomycetes bacterium]|nr:saccharopine dehydrogenase NADP-binding domain-containing protein [Planctomycetota bacterium]
MQKVLLCGGGKIGRMITKLLAGSGDYEVTVADFSEKALERIGKQTNVDALRLDATSHDELSAAMRGRDVVLSALSYHFNPLVAQVALEQGLCYFDLTEDIETTHKVRAVSKEARPGQIFMPQCGLAPGFVSIVANALTRHFDKLDQVFMRVGALPQFPSNALKYNLTWSTDGLINEYCNSCEAIHDSERRDVLPLEGLEHFSLDGVRYEAFNTSGGLGTLCETLDGKVRELNYKTVRYLGHRELMAFLVNDLRLSQRREILKDILEHAIPITLQDVVIVFCTVAGWRKGQLVQLSDARKIYQDTIDGETWSAIQLTTAAGLCAVVDLHREGKLPEQGFVRQEQVDLEEFLDNRFGRRYRSKISSRFVLEAGSAEEQDDAAR